MSPTCTLPYEVLFELMNGTTQPATMQLQQSPESGSRSGPTILVHPRDTISLVLTAGLLYKYVVRQHGKEVHLQVKVWEDSRCNVADVFAASTQESVLPGGSCTVYDGIKVMPTTRPLRDR